MDADIDVFPDTVLHDWQDWELLNFPYEEEIQHSMPFISYLIADNTNNLFFQRGYNRIRYKMVPSTRATRTNHQYTLNNLSERAEDTSWFEVDRRIRKDPNRSKSLAAPAAAEEEEEEEIHPQRHRRRHQPYHHPSSSRRRPVHHHGKMNVTLAFRHRNVFTTKKMFTFGIRNVDVDTCHVYQTKAYPLLVYLPKPHVHLNNQNRTFSPTTYRSYIPHLIPPNSVVKIQHPTFYVLLTAGKVLFAVDVVHVHTLPEIEMAYGIVIRDELQPLPPPPKQLHSRPPPPSIEGSSVMPLPVEWDRRSGQMRKRMAPPPPPKFVNLARQQTPPPPPPPTATIEPPSKFSQFAWPAAAAPIEPRRPGPSWEPTDWERTEKKKSSLTTTTTTVITLLSDDDEEEEEEDKIFISRRRPEEEDIVVPPEDIVSSPDLDTLLKTMIQHFGEEEVDNMLEDPEKFFESTPAPSIVEQAMDAAGLDPHTEQQLVSLSSETQHVVITNFELPDFQDLYDFLNE